MSSHVTHNFESDRINEIAQPRVVVTMMHVAVVAVKRTTNNTNRATRIHHPSFLFAGSRSHGWTRRTFVSGRRPDQQQQQQQQYARYARDPGLQWTSVVSHPSNSVPRPTEDIPSRSEQVQRLRHYGDMPDANAYYDVLVIGGGATGAGCALDAASRGLTVAAVERGDFASETSSRSTKLIWAGIKYMGTAVARLLSSQLFLNPYQTLHTFYTELKMVRSCHIERRYMTNKQQHLVRAIAETDVFSGHCLSFISDSAIGFPWWYPFARGTWTRLHWGIACLVSFPSWHPLRSNSTTPFLPLRVPAPIS
jgi:hypothetical protein